MSTVLFFHLHHMSLRAREEMMYIKDRYFSLNRTLLITIGLWPYRTSFTRLRSCCVYVIMITGIIFQLTPFLASKCTADLLIKIFSVLFFSICFMIKFNMFFINSKTLQYLIDQFQWIFNTLKENEVIIIDDYRNIARRYTIGLIILAVTVSSSLVISNLCVKLLCVNSMENNSVQQNQLIITAYFINQNRYSSFALLHMILVIGIGIFVAVATGSMLIAYFHYTCALLRIASVRIEYAISFHTYKDNSLLNENVTHRHIICAVDIHRKAMWLSTYLMRKVETSFLFLIIFGVLALSLNICRIFQIELSICNVFELLLYSILALICFMYILISNVIGQEVINHYNDVFESVYGISWYLLPLHLQKVILLLLQRGNKAFGLNVGGLFVASLQCFCSLINASMSYITVMKSTR